MLKKYINPIINKNHLFKKGYKYNKMIIYLCKWNIYFYYLC